MNFLRKFLGFKSEIIPLRFVVIFSSTSLGIDFNSGIMRYFTLILLGAIGLISGILSVQGRAFIERFISYIERMLAIFLSKTTRITVDVTKNNRIEALNLAI